MNAGTCQACRLQARTAGVMFVELKFRPWSPMMAKMVSSNHGYWLALAKKRRRAWSESLRERNSSAFS